MGERATVWDILSRHGKQSVIVGVPATYPPKPLNGCLVGCFLSPSTPSDYTYPADLRQEIAAAVGDYIIDVPDYRTSDVAGLLGRIYAMTDKRFELVRYLMEPSHGTCLCSWRWGPTACTTPSGSIGIDNHIHYQAR